MSSITSIGAAGMQAAAARLQRAANSIAKMGAGEGGQSTDDLAGAMIDAIVAKTQFTAATKIVEIGRKMDQATLDMMV